MYRAYSEVKTIHYYYILVNILHIVYRAYSEVKIYLWYINKCGLCQTDCIVVTTAIMVSTQSAELAVV